MNLRASFFAAACMGMMLGGMTHTAIAEAGADKSRVYVAFKNGAMGPTYRALKRNGAEFHHTFDKLNAFVVTMPVQALNGLRNNPNIEYIEEDVKRYPMAQTTPWGIPAVQADEVTYIATPPEGDPAPPTVCIIDSGYSFHEDLPQGANITFTNSGISGAWNNDSCGHGTHVAGTIAALSNGVGVKGVVPGGDINLHIVKVFGDNGTPGLGSCSWTYSSNLVEALGECESAGAKIVSMSLGGSIKSRSEDLAFRAANDRGVLSIAAAGNGGGKSRSYPASYNSVMSVAAVDSALVVADFSQQNSQVEIAAPGVAVRSTVPETSGSEESLEVNGQGFEATGMEGSPAGSVTGALFRCDAVDGLGSPNDCAGASGKVCLIQRGAISFAAKVQECQDQSGTGAVIYNNSAALFSGTLGGEATSIPSVGVSGVDGTEELLSRLGQSATVTTTAGNYAFFDGTSMATPHVSGVAALVWSQDTSCSNQDIRNVLTAKALDLGPAGKDNAYGYGLVQAKEAADALDCGTTEPPPPPPPVDCPAEPVELGSGMSCGLNCQCSSGNCKGKPGSKTCK